MSSSFILIKFKTYDITVISHFISQLSLYLARPFFELCISCHSFWTFSFLFFCLIRHIRPQWREIARWFAIEFWRETLHSRNCRARPDVGDTRCQILMQPHRSQPQDESVAEVPVWLASCPPSLSPFLSHPFLCHLLSLSPFSLLSLISLYSVLSTTFPPLALRFSSYSFLPRRKLFTRGILVTQDESGGYLLTIDRFWKQAKSFGHPRAAWRFLLSASLPFSPTFSLVLSCPLNLSFFFLLFRFHLPSHFFRIIFIFPPTLKVPRHYRRPFFLRCSDSQPLSVRAVFDKCFLVFPPVFFVFFSFSFLL